jgi:hypothetical protein
LSDEKSFVRTGHGAGSGTPHVEVSPPDELSPATPAITVRAERNTNGTFAAGNTVARSKRCRVGNRGSTAVRTDPSYAPFERYGKRYASHRRSELALAHGGTISAGVGGLIETASVQLAQSRFLAAKAAETADGAMMKLSSGLANDARQNELAAWELAAREAKTRGLEPYDATQDEAFK